MNHAILSLISMLSGGDPSTKPKTQTTCVETDAALESVIARVLLEVRSDDADGFLKDTTKGKLRFGDVVVSHDDLQRDFTAQSRLYCDIFECDGTPGKWHDYFSGDVIQRSVSNEFGTTVADVITGRYGDGEFSMQFARTSDCTWQLTQIDD